MPERLELETERLLLRHWRDDDLAPFAALNADPRVMEHFPRTLSREDSDRLAYQIRALLNEQGWGFWAVEVKGESPFIGFVGLAHVAPEMPFSPAIEIGWRLAASAWGRGYATEAAKAALGVAFDHLGARDVTSFTATGNQRSWRVMERLGMRYDCAFEHPFLPEGHRLREHVLYRCFPSAMG